MREILFRGKQIHSKGEWVYGSLFQTKNCISMWSEELKDNVEVDPATVGQYTGLQDKNRKKIFEGDIIKGEGSKAKPDTFVIRWSAGTCGFCAGEGKSVWPNLNQSTVDRYEVVGNIYDHDNPELLEVK